MKQDIPYQNRELGARNPLVPPEEPKPTEKNKSTLLPKDHKILILMVLGIFIVLVLIISLIVSLFKKAVKPTAIPTPTPEVSSDLPTAIPNSVIPSQYRDRFDQIDSYNQTDINFNPPQIDLTVGQ